MKRLNLSEIKKDKKNLLIMSLFTTTTYIFQMTALSLTLVAYVISLKRVSGLISVFLGHFILGEPNLRERLFGAFLMFLGVVFIVLAWAKNFYHKLNLLDLNYVLKVVIWNYKT